jgi:hypothetical protein
MVEKVCLKDLIEAGREQKYLKAIENFDCQDNEVEQFLKKQALEFDKRNKSRTYLLIDENIDDEIIIWGYYTLTLKSLKFNNGLSNSKIKKIDGFRADAIETESILIGQLGKDYKYKDKISGSVILDYAVDDVYEVHKKVGGRIVFLECADNEKVVKFYQDSGFAFLQKSKGGEYLQMIRYL